MLVLTMNDTIILGVFESLDKLPEAYREKFKFTVPDGSISDVMDGDVITLWHITKINTVF